MLRPSPLELPLIDAMARPITLADLPEDLARSAPAQIASGQSASVEDALRAGAEALRPCDEFQDEWLSYARQRFAEGRAAFARGDVVHVTPDELMDGIEVDLSQRGAEHEA